jgi:hypothetical protein
MFMTKIVIRVVSFLGICVAGFTALFFIPTPDTPTPPYINVTRQQYDDALSRWKAQTVREYKILSSNAPTLGERSGSSWNLRVTNSSQLEVVSVNDAFPSDDVEYQERLKFHTVEGLFSSIDEKITHQEQMASKGIAVQPGEMYYQTGFDSVLGYPTHIEAHPFNGCRSGQCTHTFDADWSITVQRVDISK